MATILVAEDEEQVRQLVSLILKAAGHQVVAAANGVEAVALFRSSPDQYDLIITDIKMPVMDGYQVVELVRRTRPKAKIICMSAYSEGSLPPDVGFISKPFTPSVLREAVTKALRPA